MHVKRAETLKPSQFRHLRRVTEATSRHPERDVLILLLGFTGGMRVSEVARIEVADVMLPGGQLREEVSLRAAITKGCRQRCLYLSHPKTIATLERYIEWRWQNNKSTAMDRRIWRGLMPQTTLILTHKGGSYELSVKRRTNDAGELVEYLAADSLQSYIAGLYRAAGFGPGYSITLSLIWK
ncbi:site-specific integrase [Ralstonia pseudosolanacearum]|nr:site-specific integrase [Ralstonia solanacearum]